MAATDASAALTLANRFHALAVDYSSRPVIVRRATLPSLMKLMKHPTSWEARHVAAQTLEMLASHPDNPEFMCREKGFIQAVVACFNESSLSDPELHATYSSILMHLRKAMDSEEGGESSQSLAGAAADAAAGSLAAEEASVRTVKNRATRVRQATTATRKIVLAVPGLADRRTAEVFEDLLQTTRGVVSYTMNERAKQATVFVGIPTQTLVKVITDAGLACRVEVEEAVERPSSSSSSYLGGPSPTYASGLSSQRELLMSGRVDSDYKKSLVLHGADGNSLAARVQKQREEEQKKRLDSERGTIVSFLSKLTSSWW